MLPTIKDPLSYLLAFDPSGEHTFTKSIRLVLRDMNNTADKVDTGIVFTRDTQEAKEAVVSWLQQSPLYVWPYAEVEYASDFQHATLNVRIDATVFKALNIKDDGMSVTFDLARQSATTLAHLFRHVCSQRKIHIG